MTLKGSVRLAIIFALSSISLFGIHRAQKKDLHKPKVLHRLSSGTIIVGTWEESFAGLNPINNEPVYTYKPVLCFSQDGTLDDALSKKNEQGPARAELDKLKEQMEAEPNPKKQQEMLNQALMNSAQEVANPLIAWYAFKALEKYKESDSPRKRKNTPPESPVEAFKPESPVEAFKRRAQAGLEKEARVLEKRAGISH